MRADAVRTARIVLVMRSDCHDVTDRPVTIVVRRRRGVSTFGHWYVGGTVLLLTGMLGCRVDVETDSVNALLAYRQCRVAEPNASPARSHRRRVVTRC